MPTLVPFRVRTPVKQAAILDQMRREIVEGKRVRGSRLPNRQELEQVFQVSSATLQRALNHLIQDGFIYSRGSMGTFVSENPPFLSHYGLVFPYADSSTPGARKKWHRFFIALKNEAERIGRG